MVCIVKRSLSPLYVRLVFEVFTNSSQHKNDNIANFVLALPLEMNKTDEVFNFEI